MSGDTVVQDMFALLRQAAAPVVTRWTYDTTDPFAVTLGIQTRGKRWIDWVMARDLLIEGLSGPTGIGDVHLQPEATQDYDIVVIEICSPDGRAVLEVDRDLLARFVDMMLEAVPSGSETTAVDMDAEIQKITRSRAE
jgi:hypothetical protein